MNKLVKTAETSPPPLEKKPAETSTHPAGAAETESKVTDEGDAISMLKADHRRVEQLFQQFKATSDPRQKSNLVRTICTELVLHTMLEEELFYPACRKARGEPEELNDAQVEHDSAKALIISLMDDDQADSFRDAKVHVLSEQIKHHVGEEEAPGRGIFARAQAANIVTPELTKQLQARKAALQGQGDELRPSPMVSFHLASQSPKGHEQEYDMARQSTPDRDDRGRFTSDDDRGGGRSYGTRNGGRGRQDDFDDDRGNGGRAGRESEDGRGWYGDSRGHSEAAHRGWTERGGTGRSRYEDDDRGNGSRRGSNDRERDDNGRFMSEEDERGDGGRRGSNDRDRDEYGRFSSDGDRSYRGGSSDRYDEDRRYGGQGSRGSDDGRGWYGDPQGHSEASRRGWEERDRGSRSRRQDEDDDDRGGRGRSSGQGGWFGDSQGHSEASRRGWEERDGAQRGRSQNRDDDDGRGRGRSSGQGGWFGDAEGHSEASRRGWQNRR